MKVLPPKIFGEHLTPGFTMVNAAHMAPSHESNEWHIETKNLVNGDRCNKHYYWRQIGNHVFAIEWRHCESCTP